MRYDKICISSGHGLYVRGASCVQTSFDEVDEARIFVDALAEELRHRGVGVMTFHDDQSKSQSENLNRIVNWHNAQVPHDLDISAHFNAYTYTTGARGTEVLYVSQQALAAELSAAIADATDLPNRGAKHRSDLAFLNGTRAPAVLLETVFVDAVQDVDAYRNCFEMIVNNICTVLSGVGDEEVTEPPIEPEIPPPVEVDALFKATGKMSHFGGPTDTGVSASEGLAFIYEITESNEHLFLPNQPPGTTGLARRLNPFVSYIACRWDYNVTPKKMLAESGERALVTSVATGRSALAIPSDWGPNEATKRIADLSPGLCEVLDLETDDEVEVIYPAPGD